MHRTHTCGELTINDKGKEVTLSGWVFRSRDQGGMVFIDLRDRYGLTQLVFLNPAKTEAPDPQRGTNDWQKLYDDSKSLGREYVIKAKGKVQERTKKNPNLSTGEIEILVESFEVLNPSKTPPFTLEDETDGGDELRMKYRYLDLRREAVKNNLLNRHKVAKAVREYLDGQGFADIETPFLIKSTPEGARDFVVPARPRVGAGGGEFYALPQSPQTFKQLLMVAGYDRYYQIVRCFRDEDLRADRQPEFTQIDCEMAFVEQEDVLKMFEGMVKHVFKKIKNIEFGDFPRMTFADALRLYGNDKPDIRFEMLLHEITEVVKGKNFKVLDDAEYVGAISVSGISEYTRKQTDDLTEFVKRPQIGAKGLIYVKYGIDGSLKSSVDKFYTPDDLKKWADAIEAKPGDLMLVVSGDKAIARRALSELRLEMGSRLGLRDKNVYKPLWVLDFPLLEKAPPPPEGGSGGWTATHHPFTSWKEEDEHYFETDPGKIRANAYDLVINGVELSSGSIRIHNRKKQEKMFSTIGLSQVDYEKKFAFILNAFEYGAPPHGGIAFGFDRFCSMVISNEDYIREYIAFPKNNAGRDTMLDTPSSLNIEQKIELNLRARFDIITNIAEWEQTGTKISTYPIFQGIFPVRVLQNNLIYWFENITPDFINEILNETTQNNLKRGIGYKIAREKINDIAEITGERKIVLHENFNQFLWTISYSLIVLFDEAIQIPILTGRPVGKINLENPYIRRAIDTILAGQKLITEFTITPFFDLPNPERYIDYEKNYVEKANGVFLGAMTFILLHEFGHQSLGHLQYIPTKSESKEDEFAADDYAFKKISSKFNTKEGYTFKLGIIIALTSLCFFDNTLKGNEYYPDPMVRIKRQLDKLGLDEKDNIWGIASLALKLWSQRYKVDLNWPEVVDTYKDLFYLTLKELEEHKKKST